MKSCVNLCPSFLSGFTDSAQNNLAVKVSPIIQQTFHTLYLKPLKSYFLRLTRAGLEREGGTFCLRYSNTFFDCKETLKQQKNICHFVALLSLWFGFYYTGERAEYFTPHWLDWDGSSSLDRTLCRQVSTSLAPSLDASLFSWPPKPHCLWTNLWPSADLLRCFLSVFHLYLVFTSPLGPVSSGTFCIRRESSKCHFFSEIIGHGEHSRRDFLRASLWQSDIQVNVCSHWHRCCCRFTGKMLGLTRTIWHISAVFLILKQCALPLPFSVKSLIKIQSWWILQRWTNKHLFGPFARGKSSPGGQILYRTVELWC